MAFSLFAHNQEAYEEAVSMLESTGKAAIIHPTGTGKSFIGFMLAWEHPGQVIFWLSPSEYIFRTQVENLKAAGGDVPENVTFCTYARLMLMDKNELLEIAPSFIILDEFHRIGARKWGQGVRKLLDLYPSVPIMGLSATNIRYLDNQRDMADELFDGNVASEMTLGEAIVRGILNPPTYVLSVYSFEKELQRYETKIRQVRSRAVRDAAEKYLEALRRALEMADGLDETFRKHMKDTAGKYIVFCANVEHMYEMVDHVPEWFGKIDPKPHVYTAYADNPETSQAFADFKADTSEHLKLLFCIDMLNEGVHVEDVSGAILLRPTVSPIIYKQQIGRAFCTGNKKDSIIFDIAQNIENLYSIGAVEKEMAEAIAYYRSTGENQNIITERFRIYDQLQDCRRLFDQLNDTLTASWDVMYQCAARYFRKYGNLEVPRRYKTTEGYALGNWIFNQRRIRAGEMYGELDREHIQKLDAIGMIWEGMRDFSWKRNYAEAKAYFEKYGNLDVKITAVTENGFALGEWLNKLRTYKKSGIRSAYLTQERIQKLDAIGMIWNVTDHLWERNFAAAKDYYKEHKNLDVPSGYRTEDGIHLGAWLNSLRQARAGKGNRAALTAEQIKRLDAIGMQWTNRRPRRWDAAYGEAKAYWEEHGNLDVPVRFVTSSGFALGKWLRRHKDGAVHMTPEQKAKLDAIGMLWEKSDGWENGFAAARKYYDTHGDLQVGQKTVVDGVWLQKWLNEQRLIYLGKRADKQLSKERIRRLEAIGMTWKTNSQLAWERQYLCAKRFYDTHGHLRIPKGFVSEDGKLLANWVAVQRKKLRDGELEEEKRVLLGEVGVW